MTNPKDKGKAVTTDDLSKPFKEVLKCPFTKRIIEFSAPGHRLPKNVKVYDGTDGKARAWFDKLPPGSIDNWGDLQEKFLNRFTMLKACAKDPTEISKIIRKANETLSNFKERWVSESNAIPSVPELMQISSFMSSHKCPELSKRFSNSIPKTVDEMLKRVGASQWIQKNDHPHKNYNTHRRPDHRPSNSLQGNHTPYVAPHRPQETFPQPKEYIDNRVVLTLESLAIRISIGVWQAKSPDRKRKTTTIDENWMNVPIVFPPIRAKDLSDEAIIEEAESEGYLVHRIHVDEGPSIKIMYEYCFNMLHLTIRSRFTETHTMVSGFSEEQVKALDKIELDVCFGGDGLCRREIMKFTVISAPSPYNIILGHPGLKQLRAIPSTIHEMIKFPTLWGFATLVSQIAIVLECRRVGKKQMVEPPKEKIKPQENASLTEGVLVNPAHPDQLVTIELSSIPQRQPVSYTSQSEEKGVLRRKKPGDNPRGGRVAKNWNSQTSKIPYVDLKPCVSKESRWNLEEVQMAEEDEEKKAFYTDQGTFCYTKMPFGLKNTGATYQSKSERQMIADIAKTFDNLGRINMKLNPKKYSFGVKEGKLLVYMVTSEGI
ncbi:reverse transcriptase domain-containing protein [Tanacetum coccineum]|uniref:Reverse transcriptase domain-containing protein n=1 Tax=Tanacetum coccineum TaxID=301880 RepID=A0ABQ5FPV9_9ASTR